VRLRARHEFLPRLVVLGAHHVSAARIETGLPIVLLPRTGHIDVSGRTRDDHDADYLIVKDSPEYPDYPSVEDARLTIMQVRLPDRSRLAHECADDRVCRFESLR
jgi:hypothetical protein